MATRTSKAAESTQEPTALDKLIGQAHECLEASEAATDYSTQLLQATRAGVYASLANTEAVRLWFETSVPAE